ncbi:MAG: hypothetical protein ACL93V_12460 [Candidatus Electrothrix sp. YB6]
MKCLTLLFLMSLIVCSANSSYSAPLIDFGASSNQENSAELAEEIEKKVEKIGAKMDGMSCKVLKAAEAAFKEKIVAESDQDKSGFYKRLIDIANKKFDNKCKGEVQ